MSDPPDFFFSCLTPESILFLFCRHLFSEEFVCKISKDGIPDCSCFTNPETKKQRPECRLNAGSSALTDIFRNQVSKESKVISLSSINSEKNF